MNNSSITNEYLDELIKKNILKDFEQWTKNDFHFLLSLLNYPSYVNLALVILVNLKNWIIYSNGDFFYPIEKVQKILDKYYLSKDVFEEIKNEENIKLNIHKKSKNVNNYEINVNNQNDLKDENNQNDLKDENNQNDLKYENNNNDLKDENNQNDLKYENNNNDKIDNYDKNEYNCYDTMFDINNGIIKIGNDFSFDIFKFLMWFTFFFIIMIFMRSFSYNVDYNLDYGLPYDLKYIKKNKINKFDNLNNLNKFDNLNNLNKFDNLNEFNQLFDKEINLNDLLNLNNTNVNNTNVNNTNVNNTNVNNTNEKNTNEKNTNNNLFDYVKNNYNFNESLLKNILKKIIQFIR